MDYITCHHRKSWPTISTAVCKKCKRMERCADYQRYLNPLLFPDLPAPEIIRKKTRHRDNPVDADSATGPEQLTFDFDKN